MQPAWRRTWMNLRTRDAQLIEHLAFLSLCQQRTSPRHAAYCTPGRRHLAATLHCSVRTITRHTSRLHRDGVIERVQRRKVEGRWQTNLYRLIARAAWGTRRLWHLIDRVASTKRVGAARRATDGTPQGPRDRTHELRQWLATQKQKLGLSP